MRPLAKCLLLLLVIFGGMAAPWTGRAAAPTVPDHLRWHAEASQFDASLENWPLGRVLQEISRQTGWQVFLEPGTERTISARFTALRSQTALERLLGEISFAVLKTDQGATRLLIYRTTPAHATEAVKPRRDNPQRIPDELVLTVKPGANIEALAARYGAKVTGSLPELGVYRLKFGDAAGAEFAQGQLTNFPEVLGVEGNYLVPQPNTPTLPAGVAGAPAFALNPVAQTSGKTTIIGLIDTGVQPLGNGMDAFVLKALSVVGDNPVAGGQPTHGTSMAETILRSLATATEGGASAVRLLPVDVYGGRAESTTFDVARGISLAVQQGANVINLSLGSDTDTGYLRQLIQNTAAQGVLYLGAAGNEPTEAPTYPAAYQEVVAVTAGTRSGQIAAYANYGEFVDVVAPGTAIVSFNGRNYFVQGTSAATATASGVAAALRQATGASPAQIRQQLSRAWSKSGTGR